MLLSRIACREFLRCPRTKLPLSADGPDRLVTTADDVDLRFRYALVGDLPVLVDFDASVLGEEETMARSVQSPLGRPRLGHVGRLAKRLASPPNRLSSPNVSRLIHLLNEESAFPRVLIVGGATVGNGMEALYDDPRIGVCGFDIYATPVVQFVADAHSIPVADSSFDGVVIQAVLEHVVDPSAVIAEIHRVLRPGGFVYAETPFLQPVHEGAYDFTRFTESGHRYLFRRFERIDSGPLNASGTQLQLSIDYFFRGVLRSRRAGKIAKLAVFWLPYLDRLITTSYAVDAASGVYFLGRQREEAMSPADVVAHYMGSD
jgi:SAM-dependent methyltransferase